MDASHPDGLVHHVYDGLGRVDTVTWPGGRTVGHEYDGASNLTGLTYPDGSKVRPLQKAPLWPDLFVKLESQSSKYTGVFLWLRFGAFRDLGPYLTFCSGLKVTYVYDQMMNRLTQILDDAVPANLLAAYQYDAHSRRTLLTLNNGVTSADTYTKDNEVLNLVHTWTGGDATYIYGFDGNGRRTNLRISNDRLRPLADHDTQPVFDQQ